MLRRVVLVRTDISEERIVSIIRVKIISALGTLAVASNWSTLRSHGVMLLLTLFPAHRFLLPWCWRRYVPPTRRFLQDPQFIISQKKVLSKGTVVWYEMFSEDVGKLQQNDKTLKGDCLFHRCNKSRTQSSRMVWSLRTNERVKYGLNAKWETRRKKEVGWACFNAESNYEIYLRKISVWWWVLEVEIMLWTVCGMGLNRKYHEWEEREDNLRRLNRSVPKTLVREEYKNYIFEPGV
jgi:hypothetical protein